MKKYIAIEIDIPDFIINEDKELEFIYEIMSELKNKNNDTTILWCHSNGFYRAYLKIKQIFTGNWDYIETGES